MNDEIGTPISPDEPRPRPNRTLIIIVAVVIVLLCCCCSSLALAWNYGDYLVNWIDIQVALPSLGLF